MRSKNIVPIGQGCAPVTLSGGINKPFTMRMCKCHMHLYMNSCLACGEWFHTDRPHTKTCSNKCRMKLSRMRQEKLFQTVLQFAEGSS